MPNEKLAKAVMPLITPLEGEMSDRTEWGAPGRSANLVQTKAQYLS